MKKTKIRKGIFETPHGKVKTPIFLPDATRGFVKSLSNRELKTAGVEAMVVNTFHLYLQPGMDLIKKAGGIHAFMNWDGVLVSDSGGFQVFSLIHRHKEMGKITEEGAIFKSPLDGSWHKLTPEKSIQIQFDLGTDIIICLDDCVPSDFSKKDLKISIERTIRWAGRCKEEYNRQIKKRKIKKGDEPKILAVSQGGMDLDLREFCMDELKKIGFDGFGFGGGPTKFGPELIRVSDKITDLAGDNSIRFALGLGMPENITVCAQMGWDFFDCVIPTREGRHGRLFFWTKNSFPKFGEKINIKKNFYKTLNFNNSKFKRDFSPINPDSSIAELREHSKAYLYHLFKMKDPLSHKLAGLNNLEFYNELMKRIRDNV